jgi:hypothetical protein
MKKKSSYEKLKIMSNVKCQKISFCMKIVTKINYDKEWKYGKGSFSKGKME